MSIRRAFMRTLLGDLIIFGLLHGILSVPLHLAYGELAFALRLPLLLPLCLGLTWLRWRLDNIFLFLLVHIAFIAWPAFMPLSLLQRAMLILFLFAYACYSLLMRLQNGWREETGGPIACIVIHAALTLLCAFLRMEAVNTILIGWAFVTLMAYLIYLQTLRVDRALDILSGNARQPVRTILRFNNGILAAVAGAAAVLCLFAGFVPLGPVLGALAEGLRLLLRFLGGLFGGAEEEPPEPETAPAHQRGSRPPLPHGEASLFWVILEKILYYAVSALVVVGVIALIAYTLYSVYRRFYAVRRTEGDLREYVGPEPLFQTLRGQLRGLRDRLPVFGGSENGRIRRVYYKKVRAQIRMGADVSRADTTGEIQRKLDGGEDLAALTRLYDRARYGRGE